MMEENVPTTYLQPQVILVFFFLKALCNLYSNSSISHNTVQVINQTLKKAD